MWLCGTSLPGDLNLCNGCFLSVSFGSLPPYNLFTCSGFIYRTGKLENTKYYNCYNLCHDVTMSWIYYILCSGVPGLYVYVWLRFCVWLKHVGQHIFKYPGITKDNTSWIATLECNRHKEQQVTLMNELQRKQEPHT